MGATAGATDTKVAKKRKATSNHERSDACRLSRHREEETSPDGEKLQADMQAREKTTRQKLKSDRGAKAAWRSEQNALILEARAQQAEEVVQQEKEAVIAASAAQALVVEAANLKVKEAGREAQRCLESVVNGNEAQLQTLEEAMQKTDKAASDFPTQVCEEAESDTLDLETKVATACRLATAEVAATAAAPPSLASHLAVVHTDMQPAQQAAAEAEQGKCLAEQQAQTAEQRSAAGASFQCVVAESKAKAESSYQKVERAAREAMDKARSDLQKSRVTLHQAEIEKDNATRRATSIFASAQQMSASALESVPSHIRSQAAASMSRVHELGQELALNAEELQNETLHRVEAAREASEATGREATDRIAKVRLAWRSVTEKQVMGRGRGRRAD